MPSAASPFIITEMKRKFLPRLAVFAFAGFFAANIFADEFYATTNAVGRNGDLLP